MTDKERSIDNSSDALSGFKIIIKKRYKSRKSIVQEVYTNKHFLASTAERFRKSPFLTHNDNNKHHQKYP